MVGSNIEVNFYSVSYEAGLANYDSLILRLVLEVNLF